MKPRKRTTWYNKAYRNVRLSKRQAKENRTKQGPGTEVGKGSRQTGISEALQQDHSSAPGRVLRAALLAPGVGCH